MPVGSHDSLRVTVDNTGIYVEISAVRMTEMTVTAADKFGIISSDYSIHLPVIMSDPLGCGL